MKKLTVSGVLALITFSAQVAASQVTSNEIKTGEQLITSHVSSGFGCEEGNISSSPTRSGTPEGIRNSAVTAYDPDAPIGSGRWCWTVTNIPAIVTYLPTNAGRRDGIKLPTGAVQGRNNFGYAGFGGACPPKGGKSHYYQSKVWALKTDKIPVSSNSGGALVDYMLNADKAATAEIIPVHEIEQGKSMLTKDKSNLKIEEVRVYKHHEIHGVKPLMPALCHIRQGKEIINWGTHSLTVDNSQIILPPCEYEFYIANYPEAGLYLAKVLYHPTDLIGKFQKFYTIADQIRNMIGFCLPQNPELIYCWEQLKTSIFRGFSTQIQEHLTMDVLFSLGAYYVSCLLLLDSK